MWYKVGLNPALRPPPCHLIYEGIQAFSLRVDLSEHSGAPKHGFFFESPENKVFHKNCISFPSHWVSEFKHWQFPVPSFLVSLLQVRFHYLQNNQCPLSSISIVPRSFLWLLSLITAMRCSFMVAQQIAETWGSGSLPGNRVTLGSLSEKSITFFLCIYIKTGIFSPALCGSCCLLNPI